MARTVTTCGTTVLRACSRAVFVASTSTRSFGVMNATTRSPASCRSAWARSAVTFARAVCCTVWSSPSRTEPPCVASTTVRAAAAMASQRARVMPATTVACASVRRGATRRIAAGTSAASIPPAAFWSSTLETASASPSRALSCSVAMSARGRMAAYTAGTASAAATRACSVAIADWYVRVSGARTSACATSPTATLTCEPPMLTVRTANRASASSETMSAARRIAARPGPPASSSARVRGMKAPARRRPLVPLMVGPPSPPPRPAGAAPSRSPCARRPGRASAR